MTLLEKQQWMLEDLQQEYDETAPGWWKERLMVKITELKQAMAVS